jgi:hypothetical protein
MHIFQLLIVFITSVAANGFTIPDNLQDGLYAVSYDTGGKAIHTFIRGPFNASEHALPKHRYARAADSRSLLFARQSEDSIHCANYGLDHSSTDDAVEALRRQCNPGAVGQGLDYWSMSGTTVAYFCNMGGTGTLCQLNEINDSFTRITNVCGSYGAGWRNIKDNSRSVSIGYEDRGVKFCGRGP